MYVLFLSELETNLRRERQVEGIAAAKERGVYAKNGGRKATLDADKVRGNLKSRDRVCTAYWRVTRLPNVDARERSLVFFDLSGNKGDNERP